jgi:predicted amino acid racemase
VGRDEFLAALELAAEEQTIGAEYVCAIAAQPVPRRVRRVGDAVPARLLEAPSQQEVERELAHYEQYVTNREPATEREVTHEHQQ